MPPYLQQIRALNDTRSLAPVEQGANMRLTDMDIVAHQALLMEKGSEILKAIKVGEIVDILAGLGNLAYCALTAIAMQGAEVTDSPVTWQHDGLVVSVMRNLSDKINQCTSGNSSDYSALYCLCAHLSKHFINADFDKVMQMIHKSKMAKQLKAPDLSDCLYE
jgi:hypothetical protein